MIVSRICFVQEWRELVVHDTQSFDECLIALNAGKARCILVVDCAGVLVGILTDGDVRRAIIRGISRDTEIKDIMNAAPFTVIAGLGIDVIQAEDRHDGILHIPVVSEDGILVGLYIDESLKVHSAIKERLVIMAGGYGKRLRPLTLNVPKPMLKMRGKPVLHHLIEKAKSEGFQNIVISISYLGEVIQDYFKDGRDFGVKISYIYEDEPLGTAGCLNLLASEGPENFTVITNGDVVVGADYSSILGFALNSDCDALMVVKSFQMQNPFGVIETQGDKITNIKEKPTYSSYINAGIYVIKNRVMSDIADGSYMNMTELFSEAILRQLDVRYFLLDDEWIDIGSHSDYMKVV